MSYRMRTALGAFVAGTFAALLLGGCPGTGDPTDPLGQSNGVVVADEQVVRIVASPTFGVAPLGVAFEVVAPGSTGAPYRWTFGDGEVAVSSESVQHTYATPGRYDVTATAETPDAGATSNVLTIYVAPSDPIQVTPDPAAGVAPFAVTLRVRPDLRPLPAAVHWDFGDGQTATGEEVSHVYASSGVFAVALSVVLPSGLTPWAQTTVSVLSPPAPTLVAHAGEDGAVEEDNPVTLDGTRSADSQQRPLSFAWQQLTGPAVSLSSPGAATTSFAAPNVTAPTTLSFQLSVSNGLETAQDVVDVTVNGDNDPPVARISAGSQFSAGQTVSLDGTLSSDPEQQPLIYSWRQTGGPTLTLPDRSGPRLEFPAPPRPFETTYAFDLVVSDGSSLGTASVGFRVLASTAGPNLPPMAGAGADQTATAGPVGQAMVALDGSGSMDLDGTIVRYRWSEAGVELFDGSAPTTTVSLAVGVHDITLEVTDDDGDSSTDTVRVTVTPGAEATMIVTPEDPFAPSGPPGGPFSPSLHDYVIANIGGAPLTWTASADVNWVSLSAGSGTIQPGQSTVLSVAINAAASALGSGGYIGRIAFENTSVAAGSPQYPAVAFRELSLDVNAPPPNMTVSSGGFTASGPQGGPFTPTSQTYTLTNSGGQLLGWSANVASPWVSLSSPGGTLNPGASTSVTVALTSAANTLTPGTHTDVVVFTNTTNGAGNANRAVTLNVNGSTAGITVTPAGAFNTSGNPGGPFNPNFQNYSIMNTGSQTISWSVSNTRSWTSLSTTGGTLPAGASATLTVSIGSQANALPSGTHTDTLTFTNGSTGIGNTTRPVVLTVNPLPGALSVASTNGLTSSGTQGGPFSPASIAYTLTNTGGQSINWSALRTRNWVTLSSSSGTLAAGASTTLTVSLNSGANSLTPGSHSDTVTINNTTNSNGNTTRTVALTVNPPPGVLGVTPTSGLTSSGTQGGPFSPASIVYTLTNTGGQSINWTATKTRTWVTLSSSGGTLAAGASTTLTVSLNSGANSLTPGSHSDTVTINNTTNSNGNTTRAVALTVNAAGGNCTTANGAWLNTSFGTQTTTFAAEFDVIPGASTVDAVIGLSASAASAYSNLATVLRLNGSGRFDARNGGAYQSDATIPYVNGQTYRVRMEVNIPAQTYSVFITPPGGSETALATNYGFRSEQVGVTSLANVARNAEPGPVQMCNFVIAGGLSVTPDGGLTSSGDPGGPFSPSSIVYTLTNTDAAPMNWTATKTQSWVTLSSAGGTLSPGASSAVTVSINSGANALAIGAYADTVTFTNTTTNRGTTTRAVNLTVNGPAGTATQVSQHGITWVFAQSHTVGQFANGDWWVLGPVTITSITPAPASGRNGSMVNPMPGDTHAYDNRVSGYSAAAGVTAPVTLPSSSSLVSTISLAQGHPAGDPKTYLQTAAVLTVLSSVPPSDAFRPPYGGTAKPIFTAGALRRNLLPTLTTAAGQPALSTVERNFERVWLDHKEGWTGDQIHPRDNMPDYGRELGTQVGDAGLMLCINISDKETLLRRFVQLGIDNYGNALAGQEWNADGGHGTGRKFPILFAGYMLNEPGFYTAAQNGEFGEDQQTFYVTQVEVDVTNGPNWEPDTRNGPAQPYLTSDIGMAEWGVRHSTANIYDNKAWSAIYRECCTAYAWPGQVLAARILGLRDEWSHNALFDYQDRYMNTATSWRSQSAFAAAMWTAHRANH